MFLMMFIQLAVNPTIFLLRFCSFSANAFFFQPTFSYFHLTIFIFPHQVLLLYFCFRQFFLEIYCIPYCYYYCLIFPDPTHLIINYISNFLPFLFFLLLKKLNLRQRISREDLQRKSSNKNYTLRFTSFPFESNLFHFTYIYDKPFTLLLLCSTLFFFFFYSAAFLFLQLLRPDQR